MPSWMAEVATIRSGSQSGLVVDGSQRVIIVTSNLEWKQSCASRQTRIALSVCIHCFVVAIRLGHMTLKGRRKCFIQPYSPGRSRLRRL